MLLLSQVLRSLIILSLHTVKSCYNCGIVTGFVPLPLSKALRRLGKRERMKEGALGNPSKGDLLGVQVARWLTPGHHLGG